jgi:hypothetical protein
MPSCLLFGPLSETPRLVTRPNGTAIVGHSYETTTSRLKSVTDPLSQVKTYGYAKDNRPTQPTRTLPV